MQPQRVDGGRIRRTRKRASLTVPDVVQRMALDGRSVSIDLIYKVERGERQPSSATLTALARALGCRPKALLVGADEITQVADEVRRLTALLARHGITEDSAAA